MSMEKIDLDTVGLPNLPRPKDRFAVGLVYSVVPVIIFGILSSSVTNRIIETGILAEKYRSDFHALLTFGFLVIAMTILQRLGNQDQKYHFHTSRKDRPIIDEKDHFEIWSHKTSRERSLWCLMFLVLTLILGLNILFWAYPADANISIRVCFALSIYAFFLKVSEMRNPILSADAHHLNLRGRILQWEQVQKLEVRHLLNFNTGFEAVKLEFLDRNGRRLGKISIPQNKLSAIEEQNLLSFLARALGQESPKPVVDVVGFQSSDPGEPEEINRKVIASFVMPRDGQSAIGWSVEGLLFLLVACLTGYTHRVFREMWQWPKNDFGIYIAFQTIQLLAFWIIHKTLYNSGELKLEIYSGERKPQIKVENIEIWDGSGVPNEFLTRPLPVTLLGLLAFCLLLFALFWDSTFTRLFCAVGFFAVTHGIYRAFHPTARQILYLDLTQVIASGQLVGWERVNHVAIEHKAHLLGSLGGTKLTFYGKCGQKIAGVFIPKVQCSVAREIALIEFIAEVLGGEVKTVAPSPKSRI